MNKKTKIIEQIQGLWIENSKVKLIANLINVNNKTIQLIESTKNIALECIYPINHEDIKKVFKKIKSLELEEWRLPIIGNILRIDTETLEFLTDEKINEYISTFNQKYESTFAKIKKEVEKKDRILLK